MEQIEFTTRKWVRPEDLNANGTLFGGSLLKWIDEEATIYAILQLGNRRVVTKTSLRSTSLPPLLKVTSLRWAWLPPSSAPPPSRCVLRFGT